jgi:hypothetical protein
VDDGSVVPFCSPGNLSPALNLTSRCWARSVGWSRRRRSSPEKAGARPEIGPKWRCVSVALAYSPVLFYSVSVPVVLVSTTDFYWFCAREPGCWDPSPRSPRLLSTSLEGFLSELLPRSHTAFSLSSSWTGVFKEVSNLPMSHVIVSDEWALWSWCHVFVKSKDSWLKFFVLGMGSCALLNLLLRV